MYKLDPTWLPFTNLMLQHVYNVLLICSDYDRFLLEEDGRVEEELYLNTPTGTFKSSENHSYGKSWRSALHADGTEIRTGHHDDRLAG